MATRTDRPSRVGEYQAVVERYDRRPNQCTIYRSEGPDPSGTTAWITASEDSYVSLSLCR